MRSEVGSALRTWLRAHGTEAEVTVRGRATVGLSQETWFVEITTGGATVDAVLRCPTPASGARAIRTQCMALRALAGSAVPAPALLWADEDDDNPFGRPFLVMERLPGEVPVGWHDLSAPAREALAREAVDVLAALHAVEPSGLGSAVSVSPGVEWYGHRLEKLGEVPTVLRAALWWLERHKPPAAEERVLVHGDYRMGNLVVDGTRIVGVLDWEMAALGDPLADLAWCFIPVWELAGVDEAALVERYAKRTGRVISADRFRWYRALGYVRLAYYALSGTRAFDAGRSDDLRLAALRLQLPVHLDRLAATLAGDTVV